MGDLQGRIWFGIAQNPAMNVSPRTTYIKKFIMGILPMEHKILPEHWAPGLILGGGTEASVNMLLSFVAPMNEQNEHPKISAADCITIPTKTELTVVVITSKCCLMTIERTQTIKPK